jgi:hypothetical protein
MLIKKFSDRVKKVKREFSKSHDKNYFPGYFTRKEKLSTYMEFRSIIHDLKGTKFIFDDEYGFIYQAGDNFGRVEEDFRPVDEFTKFSNLKGYLMTNRITMNGKKALEIDGIEYYDTLEYSIDFNLYKLKLFLEYFNARKDDSRYDSMTNINKLNFIYKLMGLVEKKYFAFISSISYINFKDETYVNVRFYPDYLKESKKEGYKTDFTDCLSFSHSACLWVDEFMGYNDPYYSKYDISEVKDIITWRLYNNYNKVTDGGLNVDITFEEFHKTNMIFDQHISNRKIIEED